MNKACYGLRVASCGLRGAGIYKLVELIKLIKLITDGRLVK